MFLISCHLMTIRNRIRRMGFRIESGVEIPKSSQ